MLTRLIDLDESLFIWLNSQNSPFWDKVMWFFSGTMEWIPLYMVITGMIIYRFKWKSLPVIVATVLAIFLADQIAVRAFKEVFERLRPSHNPEFQGMVHILNGYRGGPYGFVSNHAANTFALATFLSLLFRNRYFTGGILLWASLVSYSRIYLGVHYPADIIGGAILGAGIGSMVYFFLSKMKTSRAKFKLSDLIPFKRKRL
jgi:undecaprenyl-diphosphatase